MRGGVCGRLGVSIPVFGITANALLEDQQRFMRAGVTAVVTKPMKKTQLVDMIATAKQPRELKLRAADKAEGDPQQEVAR